MRFILPVVLVLFHAPAFAQQSRQVECRFLCFGAADAPSSAIAVAGDGTEVVCPLSTSRLSKKVVCQTDGDRIPFLAEGDRKPLATATIPTGTRSAIIVFVQSGKSGGAADWKTFVIDDSPANFPDGGAYVANFHNNAIRFVIGEHKGMLRPAGSHGYAMPAERDDFNMAPVIFEFLNGEKWRIGNESALRFLPGMRYLIFAYVDPVSGRPRINTYQDLATPATAAGSR